MDPWLQFRKSSLRGLNDAKLEGKADERAFALIDSINAIGDYVTTSSCSGRVMILSLEKHKKDARMQSRWHGKIKAEDVEIAISEYRGENKLWLKAEPFILHVACKDIESGIKMLKACKNAGIKRFGLQAMKDNRYMIEIIGTGKIDIPLECCSVDYEKFARLANDILESNWKRMETLGKEIQGLE
jgi:tRNA wybutosine-synthesizing protein 3